MALSSKAQIQGQSFATPFGWLQMGGYKLSERFGELATKELALEPHIRGSVRFHDSIDLGRNQEDRGERVLSGL